MDSTLTTCMYFTNGKRIREKVMSRNLARNYKHQPLEFTVKKTLEFLFPIPICLYENLVNRRKNIELATKTIHGGPLNGNPGELCQIGGNNNF